jgi:ActR/RegA family two-component response regulator
MTRPGRILIVDDDLEFVAIYRELLVGQGLAVDVAHSADEAVVHLEGSGSELDVILLDQKLHGPGGPNSGLELISQAAQLAPFAKVLLVTGYASPDAVDRAFHAGAYDYLVKNGAFEALLRAKVRNAIEITRERRLASVAREQLRGELEVTWQRVQAEHDSNLKGRALEDLIKLLFRATPGFEQVTSRLHNEIEEIDIVVANRSLDPAWTQEGPYLAGECKNWSRPCGAPEFRAFHGKLLTKYGRLRTGFFIAPGGFASTFDEARRAHSTGQVLIIPVSAEDLQRWIEAEDRLVVLNELHQRAVFSLHQ